MNRIKDLLEETPGNHGLGDFHVVATDRGSFAVTNDVARRLKQLLERWFLPRWIEFPDRAGSRIRVRSSLIRGIVESTAAQRAEDRRLERAQKDEEKADRRPWDDD